jgi:hypothetical protein
MALKTGARYPDRVELRVIYPAQSRFNAPMKDLFIREKFTKEQSFARKLAKEYFEKYPKDRYQTEVESWRKLQSDNIEFVMKRAAEAAEVDALVPPLRRANSTAEGQEASNVEGRRGVHPGAAQVETAKPGMASRRRSGHHGRGRSRTTDACSRRNDAGAARCQANPGI